MCVQRSMSRLQSWRGKVGELVCCSLRFDCSLGGKKWRDTMNYLEKLEWLCYYGSAAHASL